MPQKSFSKSSYFHFEANKKSAGWRKISYTKFSFGFLSSRETLEHFIKMLSSLHLLLTLEWKIFIITLSCCLLCIIIDKTDFPTLRSLFADLKSLCIILREAWSIFIEMHRRDRNFFAIYVNAYKLEGRNFLFSTVPWIIDSLISVRNHFCKRNSWTNPNRELLQIILQELVAFTRRRYFNEITFVREEIMLEKINFVTYFPHHRINGNDLQHKLVRFVGEAKIAM